MKPAWMASEPGRAWVGRGGLGVLVALISALCWCAPSWGAGGSVYVVSNDPYPPPSSSPIFQFGVDADGALSAKSPASVAGGPNPISVAITPDGKSAYVPDGGGVVNSGGGLTNVPGTISQFGIGAGGGLAPKAPGTVGATAGGAVAVAPDGKSVYVTSSDNAGGRVLQFDVGGGGVLQPKPPGAVAAGAYPSSVAVTPDGRSVYVANSLDNDISQYDVGPTGALTPKSPATIATGRDPSWIALVPDGRSVYVTNETESSVSQYDVGGGGALTPKTPATVKTGFNPVGVAVAPDGASAYVANSGDDDLGQYDVGRGGGLSPKAPATVPVASGSGCACPFGVVVAPGGRSAYVTEANGGKVAQFDVGAGGTLSAKSPATVAAGNYPHWLAVTPDQGPKARFGASFAPAGAPSPFDGSASYDPDGSIARYDWDFGDGSVVADGGPTPTHAFAAAGSYDVRLTVTDDGGCSTTELFTGQTATCSGSPDATITREVFIGASHSGTSSSSSAFPSSGGLPSSGGVPPGLSATSVTNAFAVPHLRAGKNGSIRVDLTSPGAGAYVARATTTAPRRARLAVSSRKKRKPKAPPITYGTGKANAGGAGPVTLIVRPTAKARAILRRARHLAVSVAITFTPAGGTAAAQTRRVTVRAPAAKRK